LAFSKPFNATYCKIELVFFRPQGHARSFMVQKVHRNNKMLGHTKLLELRKISSGCFHTQANHIIAQPHQLSLQLSQQGRCIQFILLSSFSSFSAIRFTAFALKIRSDPLRYAQPRKRSLHLFSPANYSALHPLRQVLHEILTHLQKECPSLRSVARRLFTSAVQALLR